MINILVSKGVMVENMKKIQSFIWIAFCMMLTGCNASQEGITFNSRSSDHLAVTETTWDWSVISIFAVIFIVVMFFIVLFKKREAVSNNNDAWGETTAILTGKCNTYIATPRKGGYYSVPVPKKEYQIEYFVNGTQYLKYIGKDEISGLTSKNFTIQYLKKRPTTFRVI